jgi:hypothetical protein
MNRCDRVYNMSGGLIEGGSADDMYYAKFRRMRQRHGAKNEPTSDTSAGPS